MWEGGVVKGSPEKGLNHHEDEKIIELVKLVYAILTGRGLYTLDELI